MPGRQDDLQLQKWCFNLYGKGGDLTKEELLRPHLGGGAECRD